jgi:hypothetical protein
MTQTNGKRLWLMVVAGALMLSIIAAAPSSADKPVMLHNEETVGDELTGNGGGAFAFYAVDYPGDESVVTIELRYVPADAVTNSGVGLNVYGPNGYFIGQGQPITDTGGDGVLRLEYADSNPATWLLQVYNYIPDHTISYSIGAKGLPEALPAASVVTPAPAAATVETTSTTSTASMTRSGYLLGNGGGAYAFYELTVPADADDVAVTLTFNPDDPAVSKGVGLLAYGPTGSVARGTPTGTPGARTLTLASANPGVYVIQVYNYIEGLTIQYGLSSAPVGD